MGDADDTIVQVTTSGGEQFFKHFYNYMDTNRKDIRNLYHEQSKVIWNGHTIQGRAGVEKFLSDLPASKHEPSSLDCQPIADTTAVAPGQDPADPMILVAVSGMVQFGSIESTPPPTARPFCQSFV
ncbi:hypothetical protein T484DRAFT_1948826, partial [Baffinella frigidus]